MFRFHTLTWVVLLTTAIGGGLANNALGDTVYGYYAVLLGGMFLTSLTDRDRFYAADLGRKAHTRRKPRC